MFKDELRKEIAMRKINKEFPLKFIQLSSSFFKKDSEMTPEEIEIERKMTNPKEQLNLNQIGENNEDTEKKIQNVQGLTLKPFGLPWRVMIVQDK